MDGEHNGVSFVEISNIFVMQGLFFFGTRSFDRMYSEKSKIKTENIAR